MTPTIRLSTPDDRDAILNFIAQSGFNPRDAITWDGLRMQAMTAWLKHQLIGAIPFEPRLLRVSADLAVQTIHETVVAMDADHRGDGLGSQLQSAIFQQRPFDAEIITVFREDRESPAYRWYLKNEFSQVMQIESWFCDQPRPMPPSTQLWKADDPSAPWPATVQLPGRVVRDLKPWLAVHPYRNRYSFWIASDGLDSFALLGVGTMHSETQRVDVLDWTAKDPSTTANLLQIIEQVAAERNWRPIRVPVASGDSRIDVLRSRGFESRWSFDMLARSLSPTLNLRTIDFTSWRYAGIDYI